ncbi:MAG: hypothetical protein PHI34_06855 [Acidobacteriota bacterium]|nr:hypothetical protein [Acidobacteriota bacterium]
MGGEYVVVKQNQYIRRFKKAEATDPASARPLDEIRVRDNHVFRGLARKGVFVDAGAGRYYIDLDQAEEFIALRRRIAFFIFLFVGVILIVLLLLGKLK